MLIGRDNEIHSEKIRTESFWGDIYLDDFIENRGIPLQVPKNLIIDALTYAFHSVEIELAEVEQLFISEGFDEVGMLYLPRVNGKNRIQLLFQKAVYARAKAELLPEFATLSARELHEKRNTVVEKRQLLAEATTAIRAIKGKKRGGVHFI